LGIQVHLARRLFIGSKIAVLLEVQLT